MAEIWIIDDDEDIALSLSGILKKDGHDISVRDTTEGAVAALVKAKPDLLILDVMFPESPVAGFDLARQVRQRREIKDLPIVLLTGLNQEFPMEFSRKDIDPSWMPVQDFVEKPVTEKKLLSVVHKLLKSAQAVPWRRAP
jgi:CheY-like chemotaxis protein